MARPVPKILVVDDDEDLRDSIVDLLVTEGFDAAGARSGAVALTMLTWGQYEPDVILVDLHMPGMGGDQFRSVVQKNPRWARLPIILCSGETVTEELRKQVFGVVNKPFEIEELLAMLRTACPPER